MKAINFPSPINFELFPKTKDYARVITTFNRLVIKSTTQEQKKLEVEAEIFWVIQSPSANNGLEEATSGGLIKLIFPAADYQSKFMEPEAREISKDNSVFSSAAPIESTFKAGVYDKDLSQDALEQKIIDYFQNNKESK